MSRVVVRLSGGLGNQLFQYAFARALAESGHTVFLDATWYDAAPVGRSLLLDRFRITLPFADKEVLDRMPHEPATPFLKLMHRLTPRRYRRIQKEERPFSYSPVVLSPSSSITVFDGHWQNPRYFASVADTIRDELTPRVEIDSSRMPIDPAASISLHIRRTDYLSKSDTFVILPSSYYDAALRSVRKRVGNLPAVVFSDDPAWTREHLVIGNAVHITREHGYDDFEQFILMSRCRHNIIANSTFSWWAAWLNRNPQKMVCAPRVWFSDPRYAAVRLEVPGWIYR